LTDHGAALRTPRHRKTAANGSLSTQPVDAAPWLRLLILSLPILIVMELHKLSWSLRQRRGS